MYMPVILSCLAGGCFFWGGVIEETKDECQLKIDVLSAHIKRDKDVKAFQADCVEVRFEYKKKENENERRSSVRKDSAILREATQG